MIQYLERNLGKLLFPHSQRWKRRQKARTILLVVLIELIIAGMVVGIAFLSGVKWK
jgi:hypothetical protein